MAGTGGGAKSPARTAQGRYGAQRRYSRHYRRAVNRGRAETRPKYRSKGRIATQRVEGRRSPSRITMLPVNPRITTQATTVFRAGARTQGATDRWEGIGRGAGACGEDGGGWKMKLGVAIAAHFLAKRSPC
ncbi:hypothetical protein DTO002I6_396 [Penicillium roqueforti]|nr:hypothetical protein DTO002I6_396 [Penicillium roqueforti]